VEHPSPYASAAFITTSYTTRIKTGLPIFSSLESLYVFRIRVTPTPRKDKKLAKLNTISEIHNNSVPA
jgi:hypothetical protein